VRRSFVLCRMIRMLEAFAQDSWTIPSCMMYEPSSNRGALHFWNFELTDCRHGWRIYSVVAKKSVAVKKVVNVAKREKGAKRKSHIRQTFGIEGRCGPNDDHAEANRRATRCNT